MKKIVLFASVIVSVFVFLFLMLLIIFPVKYKSVVKETSFKYGLDNSLVLAIIYSESSFDEKAKSNKGAIGLMQLMPLTAKSFYSEEEVFDEKLLYTPEINIEIGCRYLKYLFNKYNDETTVLACYNAGEKVVLKWMGNNKVLKKSQIAYKETLNYVGKVQKIKKYYNIMV